MDIRLLINAGRREDEINIQCPNTENKTQPNPVALRKLQVANWGNGENGDQNISHCVNSRKCIPPAVFIHALFDLDLMVPRSFDWDTLKDRDEDGCDCPCSNDGQETLSHALERLCNKYSEIKEDDRSFGKSKSNLIWNLGNKKPLGGVSEI